MDIEVLQEILNSAITLASKYTSPKAQLPVLGNILITAEKAKATISATNLEVSISIKMGAKIKEDGQITIPARTLFEVISNLPSGALSLTSKEEHLKVSSSTFSSTLSGMNALDFPKIPESINEKDSILLTQEAFSKALPQVIFAASVDEARPILTGVLFVFQKKTLTLVATDGFRLSLKKIELAQENEEKESSSPKKSSTGNP